MIQALILLISLFILHRIFEESTMVNLLCNKIKEKKMTTLLTIHSALYSIMIFIPIIIYLYINGVLISRIPWSILILAFLYIHLFGIHYMIDELYLIKKLFPYYLSQKVHKLILILFWLLTICLVYGVRG